MPGTLFVVATPIGNLEDVTLRALRTLGEVDLIAAEDTRRTRKLLAHFKLSTRMVSLHTHNEHREAPRLVQQLQSGLSVAVVSDAGTPGISDPGATLVRLAREAGVPVVPIPGPSAITAALSVSGLSFESFVFLGFPPSTGSARRDWLDAAAAEPRVVVFFEAPHRITRTLGELVGTRPIIVLREATKKFEELIVWPNAAFDGHHSGLSGEFVVILDEIPGAGRSSGVAKSDGEIADMFGSMTKTVGLDDDSAFLAVSAATGRSEASVRKLVRKDRYLKRRDEERS